MSSPSHPAQERDAIPGRMLALIAVGVAVLSIVLSLIAAAIVRNDLAGRTPFDPEQATAALEQAQRRTSTLLTSPSRSPHHDQRERAEHYGWVDREAGIVHVPLSVAAQLWLSREAHERRERRRRAHTNQREPSDPRGPRQRKRTP